MLSRSIGHFGSDCGVSVARFTCIDHAFHSTTSIFRRPPTAASSISGRTSARVCAVSDRSSRAEVKKTLKLRLGAAGTRRADSEAARASRPAARPVPQCADTARTELAAQQGADGSLLGAHISGRGAASLRSLPVRWMGRGRDVSERDRFPFGRTGRAKVIWRWGVRATSGL